MKILSFNAYNSSDLFFDTEDIISCNNVFCSLSKIADINEKLKALKTGKLIFKNNDN